MDLTPLRCKLTTYKQHMWAVQISTSHTLELHGPLLLIRSNFECGTRGCLKHKLHAQFLYIWLLYHSQRSRCYFSQCCYVVWRPTAKSMWINYKRRLKKNMNSPFASGWWVSLWVTVIAKMTADMPIISKLSANIGTLGYCKSNSLNHWCRCLSEYCCAVMTATVFLCRKTKLHHCICWLLEQKT